MKYFTRELCYKANTFDEKERAKALQEWKKAYADYDAYIESIRPRISKRTWNVFKACDKLHDTTIRSIRLESHWKKQKRYMVCKISLGEEDCEEMVLLLKGLTGIRVVIENQSDMLFNGFLWGYCEFELLSDDKIKMSLLGDFDNEYLFIFDSIKLIKI